ncbi:MAG: hypothetical protein A2Z25_18850 [Planctomycetes bacterium RBG_16_55_9]|nr:MAG: hypothetical protein A2Z25_18850 [Planctomycetes bacterium RBG_16_55_9]
MCLQRNQGYKEIGDEPDNSRIDPAASAQAVCQGEGRRKVSSRGTQKFPAEKVFGDLGIQRLRSLAYAQRPCAMT